MIGRARKAIGTLVGTPRRFLVRVPVWVEKGRLPQAVDFTVTAESAEAARKVVEGRFISGPRLT